MNDHNWDLRGGTHVQTSSMGATHVALFQCDRCGISATVRLTNKHEGHSGVIDEPDIEDDCLPRTSL